MEGATPEAPSESRLLSAIEHAAHVLGKGEDPTGLVRALEPYLDPLLSSELVVDSIYVNTPRGARTQPSEWPSLWRRVQPAVHVFAAELERGSGRRNFGRRTVRELERRIAANQPAQRYRLGVLAVECLECTAPMPELRFDPDVELVRCEISLEGRGLATIELPVCDGSVAARVLSDAVAVRCAWAILGRFFALGAYPERGQPGDDEGVHDRVGWMTFLQELWGRPDLEEGAFYEHAGSKGPARTVPASGRIAIEVARDLPAIEAISDPLVVEVAVGGVAIGAVTLPGGRTVSAEELRAAVTAFGGMELATLAVREVLLGRPLARLPSLRERLAAAAGHGKSDAAARPLVPDLQGLVFARRDVSVSGTSASRRASFPVAAADDLAQTAAVAREEMFFVSGAPGSPPVEVTYAPELLPTQPKLERAEAQSNRGVEMSVTAAHAGAHDRLHFESLFAANEDPWDYESDYERTKYAQTLELLPRRLRHADALEIGCAEGRFTAQLARRVRSLLAIDVSEVALARAADRCADQPHVRFAHSDIVRDPLSGTFDLIVCSEVLYYVDRGELPAVARKLRDALTPGGHLLTAHAHVLRDSPDESGFAWQHEFGMKVIGKTLAATESLELVREILTPWYAVQLYRRPGRWARMRKPVTITRDAGPLPRRLAADARLVGGDVSPGPELRPASTDRLPILMYHRITARGGDPRLAPFRLSPESFEQQLRYLADTGHRSVDLEEWRMALERKRPIPGRGVVLTFDDGDAEFAQIAWPLLQRYGFRPIVFVVAGCIGGTNVWDAAFGDPSPCLDWPDIKRLQSEGVIIGSHSETHPALTGLTNADIVREATRSRRILEAGLGSRVDAFAYPYGAVDPAVAQLVGACGYTFGLTCRTGRSTLVDTALALPRIEVSGVARFDAFVRNFDA